jgi:hypothetical protein
MIRSLVFQTLALSLLFSGALTDSQFAEAASKPRSLKKNCGGLLSLDLGAELQKGSRAKTKDLTLGAASPKNYVSQRAYIEAFELAIQNGASALTPELLILLDQALQDIVSGPKIVSAVQRNLGLSIRSGEIMNAHVNMISAIVASDRLDEQTGNINVAEHVQFLRNLRTLIFQDGGYAKGLAEMILVADQDPRLLTDDLLIELRAQVASGIPALEDAGRVQETSRVPLISAMWILRHSKQRWQTAASDSSGRIDPNQDVPDKFTSPFTATKVRALQELVAKINQTLRARRAR